MWWIWFSYRRKSKSGIRMRQKKHLVMIRCFFWVYQKQEHGIPQGGWLCWRSWQNYRGSIARSYLSQLADSRLRFLEQNNRSLSDRARSKEFATLKRKRWRKLRTLIRMFSRSNDSIVVKGYQQGISRKVMRVDKILRWIYDGKNLNDPAPLPKLDRWIIRNNAQLHFIVIFITEKEFFSGKGDIKCLVVCCN